jgi:hypothetical protein
VETTAVIPSMAVRATTVRGSGLDLSVGFSRDRSEDDPPELVVTLANTGSTKWIEFGETIPLSNYRGAAENGDEMHLLPADRTDLSARDLNRDGEFDLVPNRDSGGCWRIPDRPLQNDLLRERTILSGGSVTGTYLAGSAAGNESCGGTYAFSETFRDADSGDVYEAKFRIEVF